MRQEASAIASDSAGEERSHEQRWLPAVRVGGRRSSGRKVHGECAGAPERERGADGEREIATGEEAHDGGERRDVECLGADAEQQPAGRHAGEAVPSAVSSAPAEVDRGGRGHHAAAPLRSTIQPPNSSSTTFGRL